MAHTSVQSSNAPFLSVAMAIAGRVCLSFSSFAGDGKSAPDKLNVPQPFNESLSFPAKDDEMVSLGRKDLNEALSYIDSHYAEHDRLASKDRLLRELCRERVDLIPKIFQILPLERVETTNGFTVDAGATLRDICASWVNRQPTTIIRYAEELSDERIKRLLILNLAENLTTAKRFPDAKHLLERLPPARIPVATLLYIATHIREDDKDEFLHWISMLPPDSSSIVFADMASQYGHLGDEAALQKLAQFAPAGAKGGVMEILGRVAGKVQSETALSWIKSLPYSPTERAGVFAGALETAPRDQLELLIEGSLSDGDYRTIKSATNAYIFRVFPLDKERAIGWVKAAPPGVHSDALVCLVICWYQADAKEALDWIKQLERGPDRDLALSTYVDSLSKTDPTMARALAAEIDDDGIRKHTLFSLPPM